MSPLLRKIFQPITKRILTDSPKPLHFNNYTLDTSRKYLFLSKNHRHREERERLEQIGFLSRGIFHDVLTPLTSLSLHIDYLHKSGVSKGYTLTHDMIEAKNTLRSFIDQMQMLITEKVQVETIQLTKLVQNTTLLIRHRATANNISIIQASHKQIIFRGVACRIQQVLLVLLNNAIDGCIENQSVRNYITISISTDTKNIYITVTDTGCGINSHKNNTVHISSIQRKSAGCGIGLGHATHIIEKEYRGTLKILSTNEKGSSLQITLPFKNQYNLF